MAKYSPITVARFWSKVDVKRSKHQCWEWLGLVRPRGYGGFKIAGQMHRASRIAWELLNEEELGDRFALHSCDNPICCNPYHIYPGDHKQNQDDFEARGSLNSFLEELGELRKPYGKDQVFLLRREMLRGKSVAQICKETGASLTYMYELKRDLRHTGLWPLSEGDTDILGAMRRANKANLQNARG